MNIKEIAERVGVSVSTINVWIKKGNLKPEKKLLTGRHIRPRMSSPKTTLR